MVVSDIHFLTPSETFEEEKPYAFRYAVDRGHVKQTNMEMEQRSGITIEDIRGREHQFTLDSSGFCVLPVRSQWKYEDYHDPRSLSAFFVELGEILKDSLKASRVMIFRHGIRKRHADFPISTGERYKYDQPTSVAHIDTTPQEMIEERRRQRRDDMNVGPFQRLQWINMWMPLKGPLNDWPLTFCDASTVDTASDIEPADLLYPDLATENYQVYFRPQFKWYYLSNHRTDEMIVFKQADTKQDSLPGVPHCSFYNPLASRDEPPRESIEVRALVWYDLS